MAGLTLGGGYGPLNGVAGLAADNLLGAEVVLADGTVVTATDTVEQDLLWALRGGGGNFGVVTSMKVRLYPIPVVCTGRVIFPFGQARDVLARFGELIAEAPDELTVQTGFLSTPDGTSVLFFLPIWSGAPDDAAPWIKRLESLGTPVMSAVGPADYGEPLRRADEMFARDGRHYATRTRNLAALTPQTVDALAAAAAARTSPLSAINLHHFHGAAARVPLQATAFGVRQRHFMAEIIACWRPVAGQDADSGAAHRRWADTTTEHLNPHALPGGYPNLLTTDEPERVAHAYGPNAPRLITAKKAYDPGNVFTATPLPDRSGSQATPGKPVVPTDTGGSTAATYPFPPPIRRIALARSVNSRDEPLKENPSQEAHADYPDGGGHPGSLLVMSTRRPWLRGTRRKEH